MPKSPHRFDEIEFLQQNMNEFVSTERPPMNQEEYDAEYGGNSHDGDSMLRQLGRTLHNSYCYPFTGWIPFMQTVFGFMPILDWLPRYAFKKDLIPDIIGGLTTGIMHVPQGIAYSTLAGVDPVYGLYASCFPAFFYMFFGTSRHVSIGSFAVVALMAGVANDNVMSKHSGGFVEFLKNDSQLEIVTHFEVSPINIATTLTFSIGIWQILCGIFRLQFLMTYFSDPLVSGFTTGAAVHVFLAQVDDIMGVNVPKASGAGYIFKRLYDLATQVPHVNLTALVISLASISFLYIGKEYLSPSLAKKYKLRVPIPFELILIAITAALSSLFHWHEKSSLQIVGTIPAGLPHPDLPTFSILKECMVQSIAISIVIIAVHISMSKMLGKKLGYSIDDNQELYAIGLTSLLGGFFPVFPVSTALGRTMVNVKSGTRTQLSTVFSCALLLSIILWLGPLLKDLPKCVLASIITVALKSMFMKYGELRKIYPVSKIDFSIWIISFIFTVFIDVMEGLAIALIFALFTVIWRFQWPKWQYFFPTYNDKNTYKDCNDIISSDICVYRFDGPLLFTNVERFKTSLRSIIDEWMKTSSTEKNIKDFIQNGEKLERPQNLWNQPHLSHFLIIDCAAIASCDYMAVCAFKEIAKEFKDKDGNLYLANANTALRSTLEAIGFFDVIERECFFPTVKDAISIAYRNGQALRLLCDAKKEQLDQRNSQPSSVTDISSGSLPPTPSSPSIVRLTPTLKK